MARIKPESVLFRLEAEDRAVWLRPGAAIAHGSLAELARCGANQWIWLLDTRAVQSCCISLPAANAKVQEQALPFALEDQVLGALDDLAIAHKRLGRTDFAVAMTDRAALLEACARLTEAGITPDACVPEASALPCRAEEWTVAIVGDQAWLRCGELAGFSCHASQYLAFIETALTNFAPPARLRVFGKTEDAAQLARVAPTLELVLEQAAPNALSLFAAGFVANAAPDFTSALPQRGRGLSRTDQQWWLATAAVLALTVVGHSGFLIWRGTSLQHELSSVQSQTQSTFHELFPRITRVVDVRAQATQALAELTASAGQGGDFLDLLAKAGEPLLAPATDKLSLASISFERGALELRVRAPDMPSIERYQQRLEQTALPVTTLSVEKRDDGAEASVRIGELQ